MKIALALLTLLVAAVPALAHENHDKPKHGGVVADAAQYQAELVARPEQLTLILTEHGAALATAGGSAKLTLLASGQKSEVSLAPAGGNRFEAKGSFNVKGAKVIAAISLPGKPAKTLRYALD